MAEYPMTFSEFTTRSATEEQCREYLYGLRWKDGFACPKCGHGKSWARKDALYECAGCGHKASVVAGTAFQGTQKPLKDWFTAIWWVCTQKNGASALGLQRVLGLKSYQTAWVWLHKIRGAMVRANRSRLSGRVEVDEAYLGGEDIGGAHGRGAGKKTLVAAAVEVKGRSVGRARLCVVDDASGASLGAFVKDNVEVGSTLVTDAWRGYSGIEEMGCAREIRNQSREGGLLPHVHTVVSLLKRWLLGTHQGAVKEKHLQAYLDEYTFRFNRRKSAKRGLLFCRLLENAMQVTPATYAKLVGASEPQENG